MLIGCCHCGPTLDPPSESIPSESVSESASSDPQSFSNSSQSVSNSSESIDVTTSNCATGSCIGDVFPLRYQFNFGFASSSGCGASYHGEHIVQFIGGTSSYCGWQSDEYAQYAPNSATCNNAAITFPATTPPPRFRLFIYKPTFAVGSQRIRLDVISQDAGGQITDEFGNQDCFGIVGAVGTMEYYGTITAPINCVGPITVSLVKPAFYDLHQWGCVLRRFSRNISGVSANAQNLLPASVTLSPG